jgi:hypothetical protein
LGFITIGAGVSTIAPLLVGATGVVVLVVGCVVFVGCVTLQKWADGDAARLNKPFLHGIQACELLAFFWSL